MHPIIICRIIITHFNLSKFTNGVIYRTDGRVECTKISIPLNTGFLINSVSILSPPKQCHI